jgi:hypothetical protein
MQMRRLPSERAEQELRAAPSHLASSSEEDVDRIRPRDDTESHTETEEYIAYLACILLFVALVLACTALNSVDWKEAVSGTERPGPGEAFGVVFVHMAGQTHYLETMGLVWSCYTSARCALGFTILGILFTMWAFMRASAYIRNNKGSIIGVMGASIFVGHWYMWAIMLYSLLFPVVPFKGDLFWLTAGSNFTAYAHTHDPMNHALLQQFQQEPMMIERMQELSLEKLSFHAPLTALHTAAPVRPHYRSLASSGSVPVFRPGATSSGTGVPVFPTPGGGTTTGPSSVNPYTAVPSTEEVQRRAFYAQTAYDHIGTQWHLARGYWLVLSAFICTVTLPALGIVYAFIWWLWERHKSANGIQFWYAVPPIILLWIGWILAIIGFGSRYWKYATPPNDATHWHFGLDVAVLDAHSWEPIRNIPFDLHLGGEDGNRVRQSSAMGLGLAIIGTFIGFFTCITATYHAYDPAREPQLAGILSTLTATIWLILLIAYGSVFPHYVGGMYFEFGYSFWLVLCGTIIFFLPLIALCAYLIIQRAMKTTHEERLLAIPTSLTLLAVMFSMASLGSDAWIARGQPICGYVNCPWTDHIGLLRGMFQGEWMELTELAQHTSMGIIRAGLIQLCMALCALSIQFPALCMGLLHVSGRNNRCGGKQMPLLATALSLSSFLIQTIGVCAYAYLITLDILPNGYILSHSWRVAVTSTCWTLLATIGFGWMAKPPLPGEENILAAAVGSPNNKK